MLQRYEALEFGKQDVHAQLHATGTELELIVAHLQELEADHSKYVFIFSCMYVLIFASTQVYVGLCV